MGRSTMYCSELTLLITVRSSGMPPSCGRVFPTRAASEDETTAPSLRRRLTESMSSRCWLTAERMSGSAVGPACTIAAVRPSAARWTNISARRCTFFSRSLPSISTAASTIVASVTAKSTAQGTNTRARTLLSRLFQDEAMTPIVPRLKSKLRATRAPQPTPAICGQGRAVLAGNIVA